MLGWLCITEYKIHEIKESMKTQNKVRHEYLLNDTLHLCKDRIEDKCSFNHFRFGKYWSFSCFDVPDSLAHSTNESTARWGRKASKTSKDKFICWICPSFVTSKRNSVLSLIIPLDTKQKSDMFLAITRALSSSWPLRSFLYSNPTFVSMKLKIN